MAKASNEIADLLRKRAASHIMFTGMRWVMRARMRIKFRNAVRILVRSYLQYRHRKRFFARYLLRWAATRCVRWALPCNRFCVADSASWLLFLCIAAFSVIPNCQLLLQLLLLIVVVVIGVMVVDSDLPQVLHCSACAPIACACSIHSQLPRMRVLCLRASAG